MSSSPHSNQDVKDFFFLFQTGSNFPSIFLPIHQKDIETTKCRLIFTWICLYHASLTTCWLLIVVVMCKFVGRHIYTIFTLAILGGWMREGDLIACDKIPLVLFSLRNQLTAWAFELFSFNSIKSHL